MAAETISEWNARNLVESTCYIERSKVREIVITSNADNETTVELLKDVDALPIFVADDFRHPAQRQSDRGAIVDFLNAAYDAIGDLGVDNEGHVKWAALVNIQREIGQKACDLAASPPAALPAGEDVDHPDCATDRERELYDALMGLASAITSRQGWSKWVQGGVQIAPIVHKALRLDASSVPSTDREGGK